MMAVEDAAFPAATPLEHRQWASGAYCPFHFRVQQRVKSQ